MFRLLKVTFLAVVFSQIDPNNVAFSAAGYGEGPQRAAVSQPQSATPKDKSSTIRISAGDPHWARNVERARPGDVVLLEPGTYSGPARITLKGTVDKPIVIRGSGLRDTTLNGRSDHAAIELVGARHVVLENLRITNPDADGNDGIDRIVRKGEGANEEGVILRDTSDTIVRSNVFYRIGTRGVLISGSSSNNLIENNLFNTIGNNTASGDINLNGQSHNIIRNNLLAGNVDGVVFGHASEGNIIEMNISVNHWQENCFDIKSTRASAAYPTYIRDNVCYANKLKRLAAIGLNDSSSHIRVINNIIRFGNVDNDVTVAISIQGREGKHARGPLEYIDIVGNWIDGGRVGFDRGINMFDASARRFTPAAIDNVTVRENAFSNVRETIIRGPATNLVIANNRVVSDVPEHLADLESSILRDLESTFSSEELAAAFRGSGVVYERQRPLALSP